jgi:uncharacterized repeat protein (TIGR01451 family)
MRRHTVFSGQPFASRDLVTPLAGGSSEAVPPCGRLEVVIMPKRLSPCRCALSRSARLMPLVCCRGLLLVMALMLPITAFAATLPGGFQESVVFSGLTQPTAVRFAPDGRVFVAEKSGLIKVFNDLFSTTPTIFADLRTNVHNFWDRGLLGLELDPNFPTAPYIYVLYTYDGDSTHPAPRWGTPDTTSDPCPDPPGATGDGCVVSGRLSRLQASGNTWVGPEQVLIWDWCQQYPSHSIGALAFGPDGALYVSGGDGASFNFVDYGQDGNPVNPCGDPPGGVGGTQTPPTAEGGALRSQDLRTMSDPVGLSGTILRVQPDTGEGFVGNPLASSTDANARRIIAYGLRNPFRLTLRPGTNEVWVGDVGWNTWEEINLIADPTPPAPDNFGWPCYEGAGRQSGYDGANLNLCENLYGDEGTAAAALAPFYTYNHSAQVVAGETCPSGSSSISGLAFYPETGGTYPNTYTGALFFADYSRNCIWAIFERSGVPDPATRITFVAGAASPVELQIGPGGDLFYVDFNGGTIRRIQYAQANEPPIAVVSATPTSGAAPLTVAFDGSGSSDPDPGDTITSYSWDLNGDGAFGDATTAQTTYTYNQPGSYTARLRVTDKHSASSTASVVITVNNTPPTPSIATPSASTTWKVGDVISFSGSATDQQDGSLPASRLTWELILHHCPSNCHTHPVQTFVGVASGSFTAPDHEYPSYLELKLTATDSGGLQNSVSIQLNPQTVVLTFASNPSGLQLTVGSSSAATPFTRTVIQNSSNSISALSPQDLAGVRYAFASWSDNGAQTHNINAGTSPATYTATFSPVSTDLALSQSGTLNANKTITLTLKTTNNGPGTAQNVVVTDTIHSKVEYTSSSTTQGNCGYNAGTRLATCTIGSMNNGSQVTVTILVQIGKQGGFIDNTATVSTNSTDLNTANNSSTVRMRLQ